MKIKLSDHAKKQRIERKIPLKDILQTVKNPESKARSFKKSDCYRENLVVKYWRLSV